MCLLRNRTAVRSQHLQCIDAAAKDTQTMHDFCFSTYDSQFGAPHGFGDWCRTDLEIYLEEKLTSASVATRRMPRRTCAVDKNMNTEACGNGCNDPSKKYLNKHTADDGNELVEVPDKLWP